jgi:hypothetical protein
MAASYLPVIRQLRLAFSDAELRWLHGEDAFKTALAQTHDVAEEVTALVKLGGVLLGKRDYRGSKLGDR